MSHYIERHCPSHGDWDMDVDNPTEYCPKCPHPVDEAVRMMHAVKRTWGPESNDDGADGELWAWINDFIARNSPTAPTETKP